MKLKNKKVGSERTVTKFAWFPINLNNGDRIWLEFYKVDQVLTAGATPHMPKYYWDSVKYYQKKSEADEADAWEDKREAMFNAWKRKEDEKPLKK